MGNQERVQLQLETIDELQQKMKRGLEVGSASEIKDVAIALESAINGLIALKTLADKNP